MGLLVLPPGSSEVVLTLLSQLSTQFVYFGCQDDYLCFLGVDLPVLFLNHHVLVLVPCHCNELAVSDLGMLPCSRINVAFDCSHITVELFVRTWQQSVHRVTYDGFAGPIHVLDFLIFLDKGKQVVYVVQKLMETRLLNTISQIFNVNCQAGIKPIQKQIQ